jgi:putative endopeptidase
MSLSPADRDPTVDPGVDFYRFANGGWLDANPRPPDRAAWGSFEEVSDRNEVILRDLLERAAENPHNELDRLLGDYYAAGMDVASINMAGVGTIQPFLDRISELSSCDGVLALLPSFHRSMFWVFFRWEVYVDHDDTTRNLLWFRQDGLGLPDRDYYLAEEGAATRSHYVDHVGAQLQNLGTPMADAARLAEAVKELEIRLAHLHLSAQEEWDFSRTLNRYSLDGLARLAPSLDLPGYLRAIGAGAAETVNVQNCDLLAGLHEIIVSTDLDTLRAYLSFHVVRIAADFLPKAFDDAAFSFYGRHILGQEKQHDRSKLVIDAITDDIGDAMGQQYVAAVFSSAHKDQVDEIVRTIVDEMRGSLETRTWMGDETRASGREKLNSLRVKVGYPECWRDWTGLHIDRTSYGANRLNAARFEVARQLAKLDQPVDEAEWEVPAHFDVPYYNPFRNEIGIPAGMLQRPVFDADTDDAVNYGAIGTVIAHEITHAFDDQGRHFDADGTFRDWWTTDDDQRFRELADRLIGQFCAYVILDDIHVDGRLTLGENIADLGGVALALRALDRIVGDAAPIDGLTPLQRFFLAYAMLYRANVSEELLQMAAVEDVHSPRHLRVRGPLSNLQAFQTAFGLSDEAPMMRSREERIEIW